MGYGVGYGTSKASGEGKGGHIKSITDQINSIKSSVKGYGGSSGNMNTNGKGKGGHIGSIIDESINIKSGGKGYGDESRKIVSDNIKTGAKGYGGQSSNTNTPVKGSHDSYRTSTSGDAVGAKKEKGLPGAVLSRGY